MQTKSFTNIRKALIVIDEILISDDVIEKKFVCDLNKCKGACCKAGDFGAPVEEKEIATIEALYPKIKTLLNPEAIDKIEKDGLIKVFRKNKAFKGLNLLEDGSCVFLKENELGILECQIEKAHQLGISQFKKPISCHLYPIRVSVNEEVKLTAVNYDEWDICKAACDLGEKTNLPLYQFVKEALIRKFGADFYEQLDGAAKFKSK